MKLGQQFYDAAKHLHQEVTRQMIPTEEQILDDLIAGRIDKNDAMDCLHALMDRKYRFETFVAAALTGTAGIHATPSLAAEHAVLVARATVNLLDA